MPYNPHQNGVAERKNRSRVETAKSMVHYLDLPMFILGRGMLYNSLHTEQVSSQSVGGQY